MTPDAPLPDPDTPIHVPPRPPLPARSAQRPPEPVTERLPPPVTEPARAPMAEPSYAPVTEPLRTVVHEPDAITLPLPQITPGQAHPTAPSPAPAPTSAVAPSASAVTAVAPSRRRARPPRPKRRRRGLRITLGVGIPVVVVVVLAAVGWFAGNTWARTTVVDRVAQQTRQALKLPATHPVDVTVSDPVLPQLIGGTLRTLAVHVDGAPMAGGSADLTLTAAGVPVRGDGTARTAAAQVSFPLSDVGGLAGDLGRTVPGSVHVANGNVVVSLDPSQFLSGVSFALTLHPSVADGTLVLTPTGFDVGNMSMSAEIIRERFGSLAAGILAPRRVCVASAFPRGLTLTALTLGSDRATAGFRVDPRILTDPALQGPGTCP